MRSVGRLRLLILVRRLRVSDFCLEVRFGEGTLADWVLEACRRTHNGESVSFLFNNQA